MSVALLFFWVDFEMGKLTGESASSTYACRDGCIILGNCSVLQRSVDI